jgi:biopolymer transport protein ExbD/biopolymer transport protein TolR
MARRNREHNLLANIDVTPLVDLTFILLIVFMVTAPAMESRIQLPIMTADEKDMEIETVVVSLDDRGNLFFNQDPISLEDLPGIIQNLPPAKRSYAVRGDETRPYGEIINIISAIKAAGVKGSVDLIAQNEQ